MTDDLGIPEPTEIEYDPHGYVSIGLFTFGLILVAITVGATLTVYIITGVPLLLAMAIVILGIGIGALIHAYLRRREC